MESESNKLFVGGVTQSTTEENLREYFSKYGDVKRVQVMRDRFTGLSRGFGFVSFSDQSSMERALQNEEHEILGRRVAVNIPKPIEKKPLRQVSLNHSNQNSSPLKINKIFVGGLPPSLTKGEFDSYFETFGRIIDSVIMYNKENKPRGFGFVTYDSEESVQKVLIDRFHQLSDKWVDVKRAIPRGEPQITYWGYVRCLSYGYYYNMYGQQVWVNNPNFVLYPSYHHNMPLGQPGNSYVHPMYVGNHVDRNGMQKDEGSSSSSNDVYAGNGIPKSATIQEAEVVENGASGEPKDEISKVINYADDVAEAASDCSLCDSPKVVENGACGMPTNEAAKVIVNGNGLVNDHGSENFISMCVPLSAQILNADCKQEGSLSSSEVVEHVELAVMELHTKWIAE